GWSNFPVNPLFAPFYYRSLVYAASNKNEGLKRHLLGKPFAWQSDIASTNAVLQLNGIEYKPTVRSTPEGVQIAFEGRTWQPGILTLKADDETRKIAINQSIMESRFETLSKYYLKEMAGELFSMVDVIDAQVLSTEQLNEKLTAAIFGKK